MGQLTLILCRAVTEISSSWINTTSRRGIKQLGISFGSIFLLFSYENSPGQTFLVTGENPRPPPLNDCPDYGMADVANMIFTFQHDTYLCTAIDLGQRKRYIGRATHIDL